MHFFLGKELLEPTFAYYIDENTRENGTLIVFAGG